MLGLAFQGQGQLDMAFDKFRKCPMDEGLMENMYNLALDYERKRQFNKAEAVFRYMSDFNPKFRDLPNRLSRAKQMSETVMLAGSRGQTNAGTLILDDGSVEKPMLGRYQLKKELGKGALGLVYEARDPNLDRRVAIKTIKVENLSAEASADYEARFRTEARSAARLQHPNIVSVYDSERHGDTAYLVMEYVQGDDLKQHLDGGKRYTLDESLGMVRDLLAALDYAHRQNIVHRDVKPANLLVEASGRVKLTDFGVARIQDSGEATRTKGSMVGTLKYMSPEQVHSHSPNPCLRHTSAPICLRYPNP